MISAEISGPTGFAVPNAGGIPAGSCVGFPLAPLSIASAATVPTNPNPVTARNCRLVFMVCLRPASLLAPSHLHTFGCRLSPQCIHSQEFETKAHPYVQSSANHNIVAVVGLEITASLNCLIEVGNQRPQQVSVDGKTRCERRNRNVITILVNGYFTAF